MDAWENFLRSLMKEDAGPYTFDPESKDFDYDTAITAGIRPNEDGKWASRDPRTGMILKGKAHPTFNIGVQQDIQNGYRLIQGPDGRYYTVKDQ